jgi:membrane protein YdbS with pleckstrin-like domain
VKAIVGTFHHSIPKHSSVLQCKFSEATATAVVVLFSVIFAVQRFLFHVHLFLLYLAAVIIVLTFIPFHRRFCAGTV